MAGFWGPHYDRAGMEGQLQSGGAARAENAAMEAQTRVQDLERRVERLAILNQALWELLSEKFGLTEDELKAKAQEVDLRDGMADGQMSASAVRCPSCMRVCNARHKKCLYCGQMFETPLFG